MLISTEVTLITASAVYKDTRIQESLCASDIKMYIVFHLGDVTFTRKQYRTNTSLLINNSDLNYEHVVQLTKAVTYPSTPTHS